MYSLCCVQTLSSHKCIVHPCMCDNIRRLGGAGISTMAGGEAVGEETVEAIREETLIDRGKRTFECNIQGSQGATFQMISAGGGGLVLCKLYTVADLIK